MKLTEIYYKFLEKFDGKSFTKRDVVLWFGKILEHTSQYPYNGYSLNDVKFSYKLNENGNIADPTNEVKLSIEPAFQSLFKRLKGLSDRCEEKNQSMEDTGSVALFNGYHEQIYETQKIKGTFEILPSEHRRVIQYNGARRTWKCSEVVAVVTRETVGQATMAQEISSKVSSTAKKHRIILKKRSKVLEDGVTGGFHISVVSMFEDIDAAEMGAINDATMVIKAFDKSETVLALDSLKVKLIENDIVAKQKDMQIANLQAQILQLQGKS